MQNISLISSGESSWQNTKYCISQNLSSTFVGICTLFGSFQKTGSNNIGDSIPFPTSSCSFAGTLGVCVCVYSASMETSSCMHVCPVSLLGSCSSRYCETAQWDDWQYEIMSTLFPNWRILCSVVMLIREVSHQSQQQSHSTQQSHSSPSNLRPC